MGCVKDDLIKHFCMDCENEFIVSDYVSQKVNEIHCPYCLSGKTEAIVACSEELKEELGCLSISHEA